MTNKEVINKLTEYYLTQDPKVVCRFLANCMIDINRFLNIDSLPIKEGEQLVERAMINMKAVKEYLKDPEGNAKPLTLMTINENETSC